MEKLTSRWEKLRLGYWRRLHEAAPGTTLRSVVALRRWQVDWAPQAFNNGWMGKTKTLLKEGGLIENWHSPHLCSSQTKRAWKGAVYDSVEARDTTATISRFVNLSSNHAARYARSKNWDKVTEDYACFSGEVGRRGALVPEPYLDDRDEPVGRRLKLMCRAGCLPTMKRVVREAELPAAHGTCKMCVSGCIEDIPHFVLDCSAYVTMRTKMLESAPPGFEGLSHAGKLDALLGKSAGTSKIDDRTDAAAKRFLKKAWRTRKWLVLATNKALNRTDTPWAVQTHGDGLSRSYVKSCMASCEPSSRNMYRSRRKARAKL